MLTKRFERKAKFPLKLRHFLDGNSYFNFMSKFFLFMTEHLNRKYRILTNFMKRFEKKSLNLFLHYINY